MSIKPLLYDKLKPFKSIDADEANVMLSLGDKWVPVLIAQPETGMGYETCTVTLRDGTQILDVMIVGGVITEVAGNKVIPFAEEQIADIQVASGR